MKDQPLGGAGDQRLRINFTKTQSWPLNGVDHSETGRDECQDEDEAHGEARKPKFLACHGPEALRLRISRHEN